MIDLKKENNKIKLLTNKEVIELLSILEKDYSDAKCGLDFESPLELTVSLILAAQCTDKRVNMIRPILFNKYPDVYSLAKADRKQLEDIIHSCGFYNNKAKNIIATANILVNNFEGKVPSSMSELTSLAGIGRKSANIILQECFDITEGIAVDTHVTRITKKLGLTSNTDAINIEKDLMKSIPKKYWNKINHMLVNHGRSVCDAKKPKCTDCKLNHICREYKKTQEKN